MATVTSPIRTALVCGALLAALVAAVGASIAVVLPDDLSLPKAVSPEARRMPEPTPRPRDLDDLDLSELEPLGRHEVLPSPECATIPGIIARADLPEVYAGTMDESTERTQTEDEDGLGCLRVELVR